MEVPPARPLDIERTPPHVVKLFGGDPSTLKFVAKAQNYVFRFEDSATRAPRILRLTDSSRRLANHIEAEIEFLTYLKEQGCGLPACFASQDGRFVETTGENEPEFFAIVQEDVDGEPIKVGTDATNRPAMAAIGQWIGKLHAKSVDFQPQRATRFHWFEDDLYQQPEQYLPESEPKLREELAELIRWINRRSADRQTYGLVHGDMVLSNFRVRDGRIIAFDFDDCCYNWFSFDIAVALISIRELPRKYRLPYFEIFINAYAKEKSLCGDTCKEIAWFSRLCAMIRYIFELRLLDKNNPDPDQVKLVESRRQDVLNPVDWCL